MAKVFLSYAREDAAAARRLFLDLSRLGANVWMDSEQLHGGENWQLEIQNAIEHSDYVVAMISRISLRKRGYVQKELRLALDTQDLVPEWRRYLIPFKLDDSKVLSPRLRSIQWIDAATDWQRAVQLLSVTMKLRDAAVVASRSRPGAPGVKVTVNLSSEATQALQSLAGERGVSVAEVIRRAVKLESYLRDVTAANGKVRVESEDGSIKELVIM